MKILHPQQHSISYGYDNNIERPLHSQGIGSTPRRVIQKTEFFFKLRCLKFNIKELQYNCVEKYASLLVISPGSNLTHKEKVGPTSVVLFQDFVIFLTYSIQQLVDVVVCTLTSNLFNPIEVDESYIFVELMPCTSRCQINV